jgi:tetratricopeptide (TPR) repeat protein
LDPLSFLAHRQTAYCLLMKRRSAEAVAICERLVRLQPETAENRVMMAYVCCKAGKLEEANREADVARGLKIPPNVKALLAAVYALLGRREEARELIREIEAGSPQQYCSPTHLATAYAALGERDTALRMMEEEFEEDPTSFLFNFQLSPFDSIRDDPRFVSLKERLKLPKRRDD